MPKKWKLKRQIRSVIKRGEFSIFFQPIFSVRDQDVVGFEALTRFTGRPYRSPDLWFEDAKSANLHHQLEHEVMLKTLQELETLPSNYHVSINVTPAYLLSDLSNGILQNVKTDRFVLELTEHEKIADYDQIRTKILPLRESGTRLAVDDAGAGFASFWHVLQLKPDLIKLDMKIVKNIDSDISKARFVESIINFAKNTGSRVIAEGVETQEEFVTLVDLGVDMLQGYFLGYPKPKCEISVFNLS